MGISILSITKFNKDKIINNKYTNYFLITGLFKSNDIIEVK